MDEENNQNHAMKWLIRKIKPFFLLMLFTAVGIALIYLAHEPESRNELKPRITPRSHSLPPTPVPVPALYTAVRSGNVGAVAEILVLLNNPGASRDELNLQYVEEDLSHESQLIGQQLIDNALYMAADRGYSEIVELLLAAGADPDFFNQDRETPLLAAAENNHIVIVRLLLDCGALINEHSVLNWFDESALHRAVAENNIEIVQLLIERGADVNQRARRQASPLLLAAMRGHLKLVQLLVEKGAAVRFDDNCASDDNALYHAVDNGHYDVVRYLLENGADVNQREGFRGFTPLHAAAADGNSDLVKLLLKYKAGVSGNPMEDWYEQIPCPVGLAAEGRHQEVVRILVQHGVDIDCCGEDEWTALQIASTEGDFELVRFLLEHGADVNRTGGDTVATPLDLALKNKHDLLCEYLRKQGAKTGSEIWQGQ